MADENSIAIVGLAGHFPGARSVHEYWSMLKEGRDATQWLTSDELLAKGEKLSTIEKANYVRATMPLPDMEMFDAGFFGFSPREAAILDPQHRHFLECCWEALEDAGHVPEQFDGAIGVFGGCGMQAYLALNLLTNPELVESEGMFLLRHTGNDKDFLTTRASYTLNLRGPSVGVQTACSTSLVAVHTACQSLLSRECDMALAGGASIDLPHGRGYKHETGEILSSTGYCRAFDANADGTLFGSGAGVIALRRLEDALQDGDNVQGVILASAVNNDGARKVGYLAPSVEGQAEAAIEALAVGGVDPASVSYIEAHGTGTLVGDPIELEAMNQAYDGADRKSINIGSVKTNIGHLDTAAGVASLIKVALSLKEEVVPATLNFTEPNKSFNFEDSPFEVAAKSKAWKSQQSMNAEAPLRRAGVNSLGVGGTNAHVIIEEAPARIAPQSEGPHILALSAKTPDGLERLVDKWSAFMNGRPSDFLLANAAYTTQTGRKAFDHRLSIVAQDEDDLIKQLHHVATKRSVTPQAVVDKPRIVFMYPGGGVQYPNAGRKLYLDDAVFRAAVDDCFAKLEPELAADLRALMFESNDVVQDGNSLERPTLSLLAVFIVEVALTKVWEAKGVVPDAVIGHSAGEYAAAVATGVMSLRDAITIILERGAVFEATKPGGMISVQAPESVVRDMVGTDLDIAVVNSAQITVVSGEQNKIEYIATHLEAEGIKHTPIRINVAAHSRMLDEGLGRFKAAVERATLTKPKVPFVNNLDGTLSSGVEMATTDYWVDQLRNCVRFADGLAAVVAEPNTVLLEVGPGHALTGLAGLIDKGDSPRDIIPTLPPASDPTDAESSMLRAYGRLWENGVGLDFAQVRKGQGYTKISLPTYAFARERHWIEPGVGVANAKSETIEASRREKLSDWFDTKIYQQVDIRTAAHDIRTHVIFSDGSAMADKVVQGLRDQGDACIIVSHGENGEADFHADALADDYAQIFEGLIGAQIEPDSVIFFWTSLTRETTNLLDAFEMSLAFAQAVQKSGWAEHANFFATTFDAFPPTPITQADWKQAGVVGPWQMIASEGNGAKTSVIDLSAHDDETAQAKSVLNEINGGTVATRVSWREQKRYVPVTKSLSPTPCAKRKFKIRDQGTFLITGGLGGIGLELARYLAKEKQARLVLISRTKVPPRSDWAKIAQGWGKPSEVALVRNLLDIEARGASVLNIRADVTDEAQMCRAVEIATQTFGQIHGIFHAAGKVDDALLSMKTKAQAHAVLSAKALGANVLDKLFDDGSLDFFTVFSSTSTLISAPGQSDYIAANLMAEAIASSRTDGRVISWGVWSDVGMAKRASDNANASQEGHPLLGALVDEQEDKLEFIAAHAQETLWALGEHQIGKSPVLPGTGYIEIVRAGALSAGLGDKIAIRDAQFIVPLVIPARQTRQVRTTLKFVSSDACNVEIESRAHAGERWTLHFIAEVHHNQIGPRRLISEPCSNQVCPEKLSLDDRGVDFGPRWDNVKSAAVENDRAQASFALNDAFDGDLQTYRLHPALLDTAYATGLFLVDLPSDGRVYAPVSVGELSVFGLLPKAFNSFARIVERNDESVCFNVDLKDSQGNIVVQVRNVVFAKVAFSADIERQLDDKASATDRLQGMGILASEAPAMFSELFKKSSTSLVVSSVSVETSKAVLRPSPTPVSEASQSKFKKTVRVSGTPTEQALAQMCGEILGVDALSPNDEFLSYGGGSLTGVRLFARIRKELGVELPLNALLQAPTIGLLAKLVEAKRPGALEVKQTEAKQPKPNCAANPTQAPIPKTPKEKPEPAPENPLRWTPLVKMVEGHPDKKPLFLVHGAGGNVLWFKPLTDHLRDGSPVYGIEAQGSDGSLPFLESIDEMANLYVRHVLAVDADGPYRLLGYSGGGAIAIEMAHILRKSGREVELLGMLDTLAPQEAERPVMISEKLKLISRGGALEPFRRLASAATKLATLVADAFHLKRMQTERYHIEEISERMVESYMEAQKHYYPKPYNGNVVLFRAEHATDLFMRSGEQMGWQDIIQGQIEIITLDADHHTILEGESLHVVVEEVRERLDELNLLPNK